MACSYGSAVFKDLLKQQSHDAGSDPDFRDDRRVRQELNQSVLLHSIRANMTSKTPMAWMRIIFSFQLCMIL